VDGHRWHANDRYCVADDSKISLQIPAPLIWRADVRNKAPRADGARRHLESGRRNLPLDVNKINGALSQTR
jgi:hypothetical protein